MDRLNPGQCLERGSKDDDKARLMSANGRYELLMQEDGNLVLYRVQDWKPLWDTRTVGTDGMTACMQSDGNFVVYRSNGESPLWASNTEGNPGSFLWLQDDGNLVIYKPIWATNTVQG